MRYVKFHLVQTLRHTSCLHSIFENSMHSLNLTNLYGEDLTNPTTFLVVVMELCASLKRSLKTKLNIWAQHLTWKYWPSITNPPIIFNFFFKKCHNHIIGWCIVNCDCWHIFESPFLQYFFSIFSYYISKIHYRNIESSRFSFYFLYIWIVYSYALFHVII